MGLSSILMKTFKEFETKTMKAFELLPQKGKHAFLPGKGWGTEIAIQYPVYQKTANGYVERKKDSACFTKRGYRSHSDFELYGTIYSDEIYTPEFLNEFGAMEYFSSTKLAAKTGAQFTRDELWDNTEMTVLPDGRKITTLSVEYLLVDKLIENPEFEAPGNHGRDISDAGALALVYEDIDREKVKKIYTQRYVDFHIQKLEDERKIPIEEVLKAKNEVDFVTAPRMFRGRVFPSRYDSLIEKLQGYKYTPKEDLDLFRCMHDVWLLRNEDYIPLMAICNNPESWKNDKLTEKAKESLKEAMIKATQKSLIERDLDFQRRIDNWKQAPKKIDVFFENVDQRKKEIKNEKDKLTFDEIVNSISFDEFATVFYEGQLVRLSRGAKEHPEDADKMPQEQKKIHSFLSRIPEQVKKKIQQKRLDPLFNIAYFARAVAQMHPGWKQEKFETKAFKKQVEELYNSQKELVEKGEKGLSNDALLQAFATIGAQTLKDNHFSIYKQNVSDSQNGRTISQVPVLPSESMPVSEATVGQNSAYKAKRLQESGWDVFVETFSHSRQEYPLMIAQKMERNGQKIGLVAISASWYPLHSREKWHALLDQFQKKFSSWKTVILDLRGNEGGQGFQIEKIAEQLYGDKVPYCLEEKKRLTPEADLRDESFSPITPQSRWCQEEHPFKGKRKKLYILTDRKTASGAEAFVPMLRHYPGVQVVGDNTCGCCQYGSAKPVMLPCGNGLINMGTVYREYEDGMVECVGHRPDIKCVGRDALQFVLRKISRLTRRLDMGAKQGEMLLQKHQMKRNS